MNILDKIVIDKHKEIAAKKIALPIESLQKLPLFARDTFSLSESIKNGTGIIAEFKRRSPSKQVINQKSTVINVVKAYENAKVSGVSILADTKYFGGALEDLMQARNTISIPILRKEFIVDTYQIYEAKAFGADAILLIAAVLSAEEILHFSKFAQQLGLEVLLEVHNLEELDKSNLTYVDMVGVNNRNLKTFEVSLDTSKELAVKISKDKVKISESGISSVTTIKELKEFGYQGFLIGENFMKTENPEIAVTDFMNELKN